MQSSAAGPPTGSSCCRLRWRG